MNVLPQMRSYACETTYYKICVCITTYYKIIAPHCTHECDTCITTVFNACITCMYNVFHLDVKYVVNTLEMRFTQHDTMYRNHRMYRVCDTYIIHV